MRKTTLIIVLFLVTAFASAQDGSGEASQGMWRLEYSVQPDLPPAAVKAGTSGHVRVLHTIDSKGRVRDIEVLESVPPKLFVYPTLRALRKFRYEPTANNPERKPVRTEFTMRFKLESN